MLCDTWPYVRSDLASTRRAAAAFLDDLEDNDGVASRRNWVARWTNIGDAHCRVGDLNIDNGAFDEATDAWLCALTAFEVAKRLMDEDDPHSGDVSAKVEIAIQRFGSLAPKVDRVRIACSDQCEFLAYYLPAGGRDLCAPAVICISREEDTGAALLGRLLPTVIGRSISVLIVSYDDVKNRWLGQSEILLSCCLDYLSARPDVDAARIGVFGEGLSAVLATDFALSDRRVAAAVCDGGLWNWVRTLASVDWMTKTAKALDDDVVPAHRSRLVRQLRCPVLVLAGGRGTVSLSEATKLQADCTAARIDLELAMPRKGRPSLGEIENFVTTDDCIFGWLEHKLMRLTPASL
ncbi:alpha/beta hydrolase family protein [Bradyrhizobium sp. JR3.5]